MPNIEAQLPARIGEGGSVAAQAALVVAWRLTRLRFLLGGSLDRAPQLALEVIAEDGQGLWIGEGEVTGLDAPVLVSIFLPFTGGDPVRVVPSGARGEVVGWTVTGRRFAVEVRHRVHLAPRLQG